MFIYAQLMEALDETVAMSMLHVDVGAEVRQQEWCLRS